jgi:hypothetical protein
MPKILIKKRVKPVEEKEDPVGQTLPRNKGLLISRERRPYGVALRGDDIKFFEGLASKYGITYTDILQDAVAMYCQMVRETGHKPVREKFEGIVIPGEGKTYVPYSTAQPKKSEAWTVCAFAMATGLSSNQVTTLLETGEILGYKDRVCWTAFMPYDLDEFPTPAARLIRAKEYALYVTEKRKKAAQ